MNSEAGFTLVSTPEHQRRSPSSTEMSRATLNETSLSRLALSRNMGDPRRSIEDECGYPQINSWSAQQYQDLFDSEEIASRVVEVLPSECWQVNPTVYEKEEEEIITEFEKEWSQLGRQLLHGDSRFNGEKGSPIWEYLERVDILSGIGQYGVLLFGLDDGKDLSEPVDGFDPDMAPGTEDYEAQVGYMGTSAQYDMPSARTSRTLPPLPTPLAPTVSRPKRKSGRKRQLVYLRVFPESLAQIQSFETRGSSPRFMQPLFYNIQLGDPSTNEAGIGIARQTVLVHWSRVLHVADSLNSSEVFGIPRMRPVLRRLLDLQKMYSGSTEMYWKGAFPGLSLEAANAPSGGEHDFNVELLKDMVENYQNGLQRVLFLVNMAAKMLSPTVVDPSPQIAAQIEAICIKIGCPIRIFKGSERGELAASQDERGWNKRKVKRYTSYMTPRLIVPFVDRLVNYGVLPEPEEYKVCWPTLEEETPAEKAVILSQRTTAMSSYLSSKLYEMMSPADYLVKEMGYPHEEAEVIVANAEKYADEKAQKDLEKQIDQQAQFMDAGLMGGGGLPQPPQPGPNGSSSTGPASQDKSAKAIAGRLNGAVVKKPRTGSSESPSKTTTKPRNPASTY